MSEFSILGKGNVAAVYRVCTRSLLGFVMAVGLLAAVPATSYADTPECKNIVQNPIASSGGDDKTYCRTDKARYTFAQMTDGTKIYCECPNKSQSDLKDKTKMCHAFYNSLTGQVWKKNPAGVWPADKVHSCESP